MKRYKCRYCENYYYLSKSEAVSRSMSNLSRVCKNLNCVTQAAMKIIDQKRELQKRSWMKRKEKMKNEIKSLTDWKNDLQKVINWIVKELDSGYKCISHPNMKGFLRYDAGHYYSVGSNQDLRFNFHNIHKQSSMANQFHGGCPQYLIGLRDRYGSDYVENLMSLPLRYKGLAKEKYTIDSIRNNYLPRAKKLKKIIQGGQIITRYEANKFIGIYN